MELAKRAARPERPELSSEESNKPPQSQKHADHDLRLEELQIKATEAPSGSDLLLANRERKNQNESILSHSALAYSEPSASNILIESRKAEENV